MRQILLLLAIFWTTISLGQTLEKGIYKGQKLPFTICYLTYSDTIIEVEYFFQKGGQIFGHIPAKKLQINMESFATKPAFKSQDDSINVFIHSDYFLIKRKGLDKVKVYKSVDTQTTITTLRNRNKLFSFSHKLYDEYKVKPNFDQQKFWDKLHSYNLDKYVTLDNEKFSDKLNETRDDFKKNWL
ncbi:MAG: hypothetical protein DWQ44_01460 [Bacteroidetes bacterium]|nr:MAG: hypothetical protein DWQ33_05190 [Bacteroidota bacterium]REK04647.1 MAG: hypothetical protein DWQ39_05350 [Bacteroidota bacterium]REK36122.1 MAG: hypothetical protein DWQ44_01460 [Bacteroidota bacterium]REK51507.1 MAG: hypothetical protein DWQ48_01375 [Bacteroidota bacterium]